MGLLSILFTITRAIVEPKYMDYKTKKHRKEQRERIGVTIGDYKIGSDISVKC